MSVRQAWRRKFNLDTGSEPYWRVVEDRDHWKAEAERMGAASRAISDRYGPGSDQRLADLQHELDRERKMSRDLRAIIETHVTDDQLVRQRDSMLAILQNTRREAEDVSLRQRNALALVDNVVITLNHLRRALGDEYAS